MPEFDPAEKLADCDAIVLIRTIIECGHTIWTPHSIESMQKRGFSDQDVIQVIETGKIQSSTFDNIRKNWKYKVAGKDIEGDDGIVITAVVSSRTQVIITVF